MKRILIYDLPTRLFHWTFAFLFLSAFLIAKNIDSESITYAYHMLAGLVLSFTVLFRVVWFVFGTKYAKLSGFKLHPKHLIQYFSEILRGSKKSWTTHNPASSWAATLMFVFAISLSISGYLMTTTDLKPEIEDYHELLANGFILTVGMHIAGIFLHTIRHKELIGLSMVDGKKIPDPSDAEPISSIKIIPGLLFVILVLGFSTYLYRNFDPQTGQLHFLGTHLQLMETED